MDELNKFNTTLGMHKIEAYTKVYEAGLDGIKNTSIEDAKAQLKKAKAMPKNTEEEKEIRKFYIELAKSQISAVKSYIKYFGTAQTFEELSFDTIEDLFNKEDELDEKLSSNAQWFEDHSPVDSKFKKEEVKGVSAKVITAAILAGDLYPSTAIGINLPNSDWVRRDFGSKSVTIGNLTEAYSKAARGTGFDKEFVIDEPTRKLMEQFGDLCDDLHTDLHECLGHGSGKLLPGTDPDTLKAYGSTIEEARADLFGLYYLADPKLVELGLTPNAEAYKSQYYSYMLNGLLTQLVRIKPGQQIEEAHMRNRALIARWVYEQGKKDKVVELVKRKNKTYVKVNDYAALRTLFGKLLAEIQRIKSEGDYEAARSLVETYAVKVDPVLHKELLERYARLNVAPYKSFINPVYQAVKNDKGEIIDVKLDYTEAYDAQMLRYSRDYATLPWVNE